MPLGRGAIESQEAAMDITIRRDMNTHIDFTSRGYSPKASSSSLEEQPESRAKFDTVSITRNSAARSDTDFSRALAREIARSVGEGVPQSRVAELHDSVQTGQYTVSASRIAEKLLGYRD